MDKKLKAYEKYINKELKKLDGKAAPKELLGFHREMMQQFQHERHIHLIVTVFFALFMIIFFLSYTFARVAWGSGETDILLFDLGATSLIFFITTLFYLRHYFYLENGTQRLEDITRKLYARDWWQKK